jgi:polar amino acid transport system ATP-binding protein/sulfate transport system ATP-binding protein
MVPQNYPLFEYATVGENLTIAGKQAATPREQVYAQHYIDELGLRDYVNLYPRQISGGTRQRVAIARQMMCADHYLVLDEPYSGLDPIMKKKASELIVKLSLMDTKNTIIIVTHDIVEGLTVSDTVWLMGYERAPDGTFLPGARLVEQYDLAAMDLAWHPDITSDPRFVDLVAVIKQRFLTLR